MTTYYYDVVVMGMELGPLVAGALLAKRGFRVLVVGQNAPEDRYPCLGYTFVRRPFMLVSAESLAIRRVINELGIAQLLQHAILKPNPVFQVVLERARVDIWRDPDLIVEELDREFPGTAADSPEILRRIGQLSGEIDKLLGNDLVLPPEAFMEKREFARAEVQNPFRLGYEMGTAKQDIEDPVAQVLEVAMRFETAGGTPLPPLVRFRQLGGWLFDSVAVAQGRDGLRELLVDQIVALGGDLQPRQCVREIVVERGRAVGVRLADREETTGCQVVLSDITPRELSDYVPPGRWTKRFRSLVEDGPASSLGYAVNLGVDAEVVPQGLASTAFLSFGSGVGDHLVRVERIPQKDKTKAALHVSCIVPPEAEDTIETGALRDALLDRMRWLIPFLDHHLCVIHSPFDGFGPLDLRGSAEGDAPSIPHPEEVPQWLLRPPPEDGVLGIENLPHRTGIKGLLMAGGQVISGLGTEGELIAAWGAARIAGKMNPRRERLVRSMRSKVEI